MSPLYNMLSRFVIATYGILKIRTDSQEHPENITLHVFYYSDIAQKHYLIRVQLKRNLPEVTFFFQVLL